MFATLKTLAIAGALVTALGLAAQPVRADHTRLTFNIGVGGYLRPSAPYIAPYYAPAPYAVNSYVYPPVVYDQGYYSNYYYSPDVVYQAAPQVYYYTPPVVTYYPQYYYNSPFIAGPGLNFGFGVGFNSGGNFHGGFHGGGGGHGGGHR